MPTHNDEAMLALERFFAKRKIYNPRLFILLLSDEGPINITAMGVGIKLGQLRYYLVLTGWQLAEYTPEQERWVKPETSPIFAFDLYDVQSSIEKYLLAPDPNENVVLIPEDNSELLDQLIQRAQTRLMPEIVSVGHLQTVLSACGYRPKYQKHTSRGTFTAWQSIG